MVSNDSWNILDVLYYIILIISSAGACEKVANDFGLGGYFCQVLWSPPPFTTG